VGTAVPTAALDVDGDLRVRRSSSPAANDPCDVGQMAWDAGYVYVCVDANTWRRAQLLTY